MYRYNHIKTIFFYQNNRFTYNKYYNGKQLVLIISTPISVGSLWWGKRVKKDILTKSRKIKNLS